MRNAEDQMSGLLCSESVCITHVHSRNFALAITLVKQHENILLELLAVLINVLAGLLFVVSVNMMYGYKKERTCLVGHGQVNFFSYRI